MKLVTQREIASERWRKNNLRYCPVVLRDGDGKSAGACWHYLRGGVCPDHGRIYEEKSKEDDMSKTKCYEWIRYDGTNSPMDTTKDLTVKYMCGRYRFFESGNWETRDVALIEGDAYRLSEPYEPPLPICAVCGKRPIVYGNLNEDIIRVGCMEHGCAIGKTVTEASENWRKMRGEE